MEKLNKEFRALAAQSGWKAARIANELALSRGTVSDYLSGRTLPSLTVLRLFARLLNAKLDLPDEDFPTALEGLSLEEWERSLFQALRKVPTQKRRSVAEAARVLIEAMEDTEKTAPLDESAGDPSSDPMTSVRKLVLDAAAKSAEEIRRNRGKGAAPK